LARKKWKRKSTGKPSTVLIGVDSFCDNNISRDVVM
jgi:hypothetical protein